MFDADRQFGAIRGVLLGLAAGDKNGGPTEMAVRLAESLVEQRRFDRNDVLQRYRTWYREGAYDTGPVASRVFELCEQGDDDPVGRVDREFDGRTAGCNPAHRVGPLAMASFLSLEKLSDAAHDEARLTHAHPLAGDVAAAVVVVARSLLQGISWGKAIEAAAHRRLPETKAALVREGAEKLSQGGFAPDVLRAAVAFVGAAHDFSEALERSMEFAGPENYSPVLVGVFAGARWGASAISQPALDHCRILSRVEQAANRLADEWQ